jgi:hypothetical protein
MEIAGDWAVLHGDGEDCDTVCVIKVYDGNAETPGHVCLPE